MGSEEEWAMTASWEERPDRILKELEGRLVEIHSLPEKLSPNDETAEHDESAGPRDLNGQCGRCLKWDLKEEKYLVHTFEGVLVGVPEDNLMEYEPMDPEEGGFDIAWPASAPMSYGLFGGMVTECLVSKGYCVVQMFTNKAVRDSAVEVAQELPGFEKMKAEFEVGYLGNENITRCAVIETDAPDKLLEDGLAYCDRDLTNMGMLLTPTASSVFGFEPYSRSNAFVRTPYTEEGQRPVALEDADFSDQNVEKFLAWIMRRRLSLIHLIENDGGTFELYPKEHLKMDSVRLPLQKSRMIIFRHDLMGYSYQPQGESLALQMWLMEPPKEIKFFQLSTPPGIQGVERVNIVAGTERFPGNCENCNETICMFNQGTDTLCEVPFMRFDKDLYCMEDRDAILWGKAYVMHGSFVADDLLISFDNEFFGYSVEEAEAIAPSQRWVLEVGYETLYKAGWSKKDLLGQRIGTFIGDSCGEWNQIYWKQDKHVYSCNLNAVTCTRLASCLNLTGPNVSVDTACSASLVAANSAMHMMRRHTYRKKDEMPLTYQRPQSELNYAVCMGILCMIHPAGWIGECSATMLSMRGRCFTFDSSADGFIRGEGCCSAYIRSDHDDHRTDPSDRPLATVMGSATNQDGRSASLTAPHGPSQQECIRQCLREGNLPCGEVMLTECHGTGTALGDPIEVGANRGVMFGNRDLPLMHCTSKSHVGHEEANAGTCGLLKVMLMLNQGCATPNPHLRALNPHLDVHDYPVIFINEICCTQMQNQVYGVSSFGFGGSNSRADCWAEVEKGTQKHGSRTVLDRNESYYWIDKVMRNVGTEQEFDGFMHGKAGH
uniref:Type I polyketide synthase n=1 Tax=Alexandrium ostenfeldii TaxID=40986 RepID=K7W599_9DINO|nr:type I polyketide synthase [Alexandrium ostenfeldii]